MAPGRFNKAESARVLVGNPEQILGAYALAKVTVLNAVMSRPELMVPIGAMMIRPVRDSRGVRHLIVMPKPTTREVDMTGVRSFAAYHIGEPPTYWVIEVTLTMGKVVESREVSIALMYGFGVSRTAPEVLVD